MKSRRHRPIKIGILTAPMPKPFLGRAESYLDRDYVAWVELSGANAVIIPYNTPNLEDFLNRVHGVVLPGGAVENTQTHDPKQYAVLVGAVKRIYRFALSCRYFPVWGTCLGFDMLAMMGEHLRSNLFKHVQHEPAFRNDPLAFTGKSRIRAEFSPAMQARMAREPVAWHMHNFGFDMTSPHLKRMLKYLRVVSTDKSDSGSEFMNMFEYKRYPFYGSQWHPEKPKGELAEAVSTVLSHFLKKECAKNKHRVPLWGKTFRSVKFKNPETVLLKGGEKLIQTQFS